MSASTTTKKPQRSVPKSVRKMPLRQRIRWARKSAGLSHDRLVAALGRSNRGHLIKIERGDHMPRRDLRDAIADATNVPRELFDDDEDGSRTVSIDDLLRHRLREIVREEAPSLLMERQEA